LIKGQVFLWKEARRGKHSGTLTARSRLRDIFNFMTTAPATMTASFCPATAPSSSSSFPCRSRCAQVLVKMKASSICGSGHPRDLPRASRQGAGGLPARHDRRARAVRADRRGRAGLQGIQGRRPRDPLPHQRLRLLRRLQVGLHDSCQTRAARPTAGSATAVTALPARGGKTPACTCPTT